jgi:S1-C subfamily serine protease
MSGAPDELLVAGLRIQAVVDFLYGRAHPNNRVDLHQIAISINGSDEETTGLLKRLAAKELVDLEAQAVRLVGAGKARYEEDCVPEIVLGTHFVNAKYKAAVVRIVVRKRDGDPGAGTGFFVRDVPDRVVTNRHVVEGHVVVQIEDHNQNVIARGPFMVRLPADEDLDLATIECALPPGTIPIPIDWKKDAVRELEDVLVLGYPLIALHQPALYHEVGRVGVKARLLNGNESLVISDAAGAGSSGGPVINFKGKVAAIVARAMENQGVGRMFVSAIPSHRLDSVFPRTEDEA